MSCARRFIGLAGTAVGLAAGAALGQCRPDWSPQSSAAIDGPVLSIQAIPEGSTTALYVGGQFVHAGGLEVNRIARFDGVAWSPLGSGIPGDFNSHGHQGCCAAVHAIGGDVGPGGPTIRVAGNFIVAGGVTVESFGDYANGAWSSVGGGVSRTGCIDCAFVINAITRYGDPGQGPLYAVGAFDHAGTTAAADVARWTGSAWLPAGSGISAAPGDPFPPVAQSVAVYAGALYVGGSFSQAGSVVTNSIARWDSQNWSDVGGGAQIPRSGRRPNIAALAVFDDGRGPALYAAGVLDSTGDAATRNIARWNGASWSDVGGGIGSGVNDRIQALTVFDDGSGPALYAAGQFQDAGGAPASNIARWDGQSWTPLGSGVDGEIFALAAFDDGTGPGLYVGGTFSSAGGLPSPNFAKWAGCRVCYANCDHSTTPPILNVADFICFLSRFAAHDPAANCDGSTTPPVLNVGDFLCFQSTFAAGCP